MSEFQNPPFSLRQLQYAVAVARTGGFGSAAGLCGVSQPSLSAQVAKLEDALGLQLFERHARGVHVTRAGEALLPLMRELLDGADDLRDGAQALADPYAVTLGIGVIPTVAPYLVPPAVELLRARDVAPKVHWVELQTEACERALSEGELDAIVIADPPSLPSLDHVALGWEPFLVVVPDDHPLRGQATLSEVAREPLLLLEDGHCLRDQTMALCMQPGAKESPYRATSLPTLVQMVSSGLGISVIPASAAPVELRRARVRAVPFAGPDIGRTLRMVWRSRSAHVGMLEELAEVLRRALAVALDAGGREPRSPSPAGIGRP